uniref:Uncharacterized protein n=1 Tax=Hyaloperonospora arabidopsidis (strain Emoy2) TaxID=559515 RepID=M4BET2_HYAAE
MQISMIARGTSRVFVDFGALSCWFYEGRAEMGAKWQLGRQSRHALVRPRNDSRAPWWLWLWQVSFISAKVRGARAHRYI